MVAKNCIYRTGYEKGGFMALIARFSFIVTVCFMLAFPASASQGSEKTITLVADEWCPYNCASDATSPGYMIEIARAVFEPLGYQVEYRVMSWERAMQEARKGKYSGIIGAMKDEAPDFIFPQQAQGLSTGILYVKADSNWQFTGIESLADISLGVIEGYAYGGALDEYIRKNSADTSRIQSISGDTSMAQNFEKLAMGRIDAYVEDMNVANKYFMDNSLESTFKVAGHAESPGVDDDMVYIGFTPALENSRELAEALSLGMEHLRKTGKLEQILNKYNVKDWSGN